MDTRNCKVSVIIPAYNCQHLVAKAIQSILEQTHQNLEVLIADDHSSDDTKAVIESFEDSRLKTVHNTQNIGYLRTVNRLFEHATGDYICFQDADDWSAPDRIEQQLSTVISKSADACGTGIYYTSLQGKIQERVIYPEISTDIRRGILRGQPAVCYASILFSKRVLTSIGGYREFFVAGAEDVDWLLRILEKHSFVNIAAPLYYYRFSPTSITQSTNIVALKASLRVARDLALQRERNLSDDLESGDADGLADKWQDACRELGKAPLTEDIYKINMLLRRHAYGESLKICVRSVTKDAPVHRKLIVILSTIVKLILGMKNYSRIKSRLIKSQNDSD